MILTVQRKWKKEEYTIGNLMMVHTQLEDSKKWLRNIVHLL
jgi:hypothetical protein